MDTGNLLRLWPTMAMLEESLLVSGVKCQAYIHHETQSYRGIRLYHGQRELRPDIIYLLRPTETGFPVDEYTYASSVLMKGRANHLCFYGYPDERILDYVMEIFSQFQDWEQTIDLLLYRNGDLQELCELGAQILENPVCIHDDWFIMTAMSQGVSEIMEPEYLMSSVKGFVPRAIVEDFKHDNDYLETYSHRNAQIWAQANGSEVSLYVNLWDGAIYRGRLLVMQINRDFRKADFLLAEFLTQRAILLLRNKQLGSQMSLQTLDDVVFSLLQGKRIDPAEQTQLLALLHWNPSDVFVCVRIKNQQDTATSMMEHMLHGELFRVFPEAYIMMSGHEQYMILDISQRAVSISQIHHQLAPLCRDYCLYAGISSPVTGIREVHSAYYQAGAALDQAFRLHNDKWILSFSDCAMDYILRTIPAPLSPEHLISPELRNLQAYDREKGTQYYETLREYLLQERDIPRTSEALIIHRTTLIYRLKKIQTLIHINLEDPWQRMYLMLSLWIQEKGIP